MNKNILTSCEVNSENASISFDGTILAQAGIDVKTLNSKISFTIHIINNYNEEYVCNVKIGAIAQLGERCAGSAKVRGSNPLGSIP